MKVRFAKFITRWIWLLCVVLIGCGYRVTGPAMFPGNVKHIYILMLENKTAETGVENIITGALIDEFTRNSPAALTRRERAQAYLSGSVAGIRNTTISHRSPGISSERRVQVSVVVKLKDTQGREIWSTGAVSANEAYGVSPDKLVTEQNRRAAISVLSRRLAEDIFKRLTENF
ncbi:MAG: LPS assembly lipoprotein LptE [Desulfobacterales bacterium]|nr:LPS assembly lipoprotein LptE [Desulfobacterales bacterium]